MAAFIHSGAFYFLAPAATFLACGFALMRTEGKEPLATCAFALSGFFWIATAAVYFEWPLAVFVIVCTFVSGTAYLAWHQWPAAKPTPIPLTELGEYAARHFKWQFSDKTADVADFQRALRDAGAKGVKHGGLQFLGKNNTLTYPEHAKGEFSPTPIPAGDFKEATINLGHDFPTKSNFNIQTEWQLGDTTRSTYRDVEVSDRKTAIRWLRTIDSYRGRTRLALLIEDEEMERKAAERAERRGSETLS